MRLSDAIDCCQPVVCELYDLDVIEAVLDAKAFTGGFARGNFGAQQHEPRARCDAPARQARPSFLEDFGAPSGVRLAVPLPPPLPRPPPPPRGARARRDGARARRRSRRPE